MKSSHISIPGLQNQWSVSCHITQEGTLSNVTIVLLSHGAMPSVCDAGVYPLRFKLAERFENLGPLLVFLFFNDLFIFVLCALVFCQRVSLCVTCPGTGVTDSCELPCGCWSFGRASNALSLS